MVTPAICKQESIVDMHIPNIAYRAKYNFFTSYSYIKNKTIKNKKYYPKSQDRRGERHMIVYIGNYYIPGHKNIAFA